MWGDWLPGCPAGASAVLLFGVIESKLAQPRNLLGTPTPLLSQGRVAHGSPMHRRGHFRQSEAHKDSNPGGSSLGSSQLPPQLAPQR